MRSSGFTNLLNQPEPRAGDSKREKTKTPVVAGGQPADSDSEAEAEAAPLALANGVDGPTSGATVPVAETALDAASAGHAATALVLLTTPADVAVALAATAPPVDDRNVPPVGTPPSRSTTPGGYSLRSASDPDSRGDADGHSAAGNTEAVLGFEALGIEVV